tara:strand:- start:63742 stop:64293 length:552 start_codon:yes stop_codon:yes gene_type:complete
MSVPVPEPEFSHIVRLDEIGRIHWPAHVEANAEQRAALAQRFGFLTIERLMAEYSMSREGATITATGKIEAVLAQPCIATGEPVAETVSEPFLIRFVPEEGASEPTGEEEIELDAEECDMLFYTHGRIDIGEAIAETLALAVNPYPRSPHAEEWLRAAGVKSEEEAAAEASPFAALAALKGKG